MAAIELTGGTPGEPPSSTCNRRMDWEPNANVGIGLDRDRFWDLMIGAIETLGRAS